MSLNSVQQNKREISRLSRQPEHSWQLSIEGDMLITKNITNISPSGLSFKAPFSTQLQKGQVVKMNLVLDHEDSFDCEGEIIWVIDSLESSGSMRQLGVKFSKLPARFDSTIMHEINIYSLKEKRATLESGRVPEFHRSQLKQIKTLRSIVLTVCGVLVLVATTAAFVTAIYLHQSAHPEESIEYQFNKAIIKKVMNSK